MHLNGWAAIPRSTSIPCIAIPPMTTAATSQQMKPALTAAILLLATTPAFAHRLDEYLQATLISVEKDRIQVEIRLTPGIAVLPIVLAKIDADGDGIISQAEQRAYAQRILQDLPLSIDGDPLREAVSSHHTKPASNLAFAWNWCRWHPMSRPSAMKAIRGKK